MHNFLLEIYYVISIYVREDFIEKISYLEWMVNVM